jgi:hypothetical protein
MTGQLTIIKQNDKAFRRFCLELEIGFTCIGEGQDGDRYEIEFENISDVYALGQMVGVESLYEYQTKNQ